jgi:hypothetical protein
MIEKNDKISPKTVIKYPQKGLICKNHQNINKSSGYSQYYVNQTNRNINYIKISQKKKFLVCSSNKISTFVLVYEYYYC